MSSFVMCCVGQLINARMLLDGLTAQCVLRSVVSALTMPEEIDGDLGW